MHDAMTNPPTLAYTVIEIRPTLSAMRFGLDRLSFEVVVPRPEHRVGGVVVLPDMFFADHVKEVMERVVEDHFPALKTHFLVGLFFTGRYGGTPSDKPGFSSRSPSIHISADTVNLTDVAMLVAATLRAESVLVVPWGASEFQLLSAKIR